MTGQTISHYRVTAKLGEGGMGAVYRADDLKLDRSVALKLLPTDAVATPDSRERLLKEARVASRLNHPNIATIYEVGEADETPYIAMELVRGETLNLKLLRGALPVEELLEIARPVAEGLDAAHRSGVLHRDIKPGNIMLDDQGRVKILDFGLAIMLGRERAAGESLEAFSTRTGAQVGTAGTVPYMAPEQLRGQPADARTDIFSFGVLLYECLTRRLPFQGETAIDVMHAILHDPPVPLDRLVPDISPVWQRFIERCMAKAPEQRFHTMTEVLEAMPREAARTGRVERSIAVLYFENLSESKDDAYFRDGMTEDIITELSKIKELRVFPRSAVLAYRDKPATAPEIGEALNALYVLEGSLRRAGNRLRITAQLVETRTSHSVWAERYDRQMEDVFAIQDEIAQNIARALRVMLTEEEKEAIVKAPTTEVQAYDYYLRGRQFFYQWRRQGFEFAARMYRRAIEIDPDYARAHAGLADCYAALFDSYDPSETNRAEAERASLKAVELDPTLAEAHSARGLALSLAREHREARKEFETAIRLNPKLFEAFYFHARSQLAQGNLAEAAQLFEEASRLRPEDYQAPALLASCYTGLGRKQEADDAYLRCARVAEGHLEMHPDDGRALYLGAYALCSAGQVERGLNWAERALIMDPDEPWTLYNVACVYGTQGEIEKSLDCLEGAVERGFAHKSWIENDPDLKPLRDHPRYQAVLDKL